MSTKSKEWRPCVSLPLFTLAAFRRLIQTKRKMTPMTMISVPTAAIDTPIACAFESPLLPVLAGLVSIGPGMAVVTNAGLGGNDVVIVLCRVCPAGIGGTALIEVIVVVA